MIPNNNLSVLPWYTSIEQQNARKWWIYGRIYPLFCKNNVNLIPFIIHTGIDWHEGSEQSYNISVQLYDIKDALLANLNVVVNNIDKINDNGKLTLQYNGGISFPASLNIGQYYIKLSITDNYISTPITYLYYSDVITLVQDLSGYLSIEWWDENNFDTGNGVIYYEVNNFRNKLYLQSDIAKPEYIFDEEGEIRDGYFFPIKQISEKRYRFSFFASEYLLDVMRFIRMADHVKITYHGQEYTPDSFLITPQWEDNGDVASVEAEFDTDTVAKKIGRGYNINI